MPWRQLIAVTTVQLMAVLGGAAQTIELAPGQGAALRAASDFQIQGGTLAVTILESNQIVIAIDSRITANRPGQSNTVADGYEKVVPLTRHVAIFFTGVGVFAKSRSTNSLADIARRLVAERQGATNEMELEKLAQDFRTQTAQDLSGLTIADICFIHANATKRGGSIVFQAFLAGKDYDAALRMFQVKCLSIVLTNNGTVDARLEFDVTEIKREGKRSVSVFGANQVFVDGSKNPAAPLAPFIKQMRTSWLLAEPAAAALLDVAMREYGDAPDSSVGYPLFVYVLDAEGVRLSRKVEKGQSVPFDARNQGKQPGSPSRH